MAEGINQVLRRNLFGALWSGDLEQAALLLRRLQEEDPLSLETRGLELDFLLRSGRLAEAGALANQLLQLFSASPRIHYLAGHAAYRAKDYRAAAQRYRESHRIRPHWRSALALARSLTQLGELDEAAMIYEPLLPEHPECYRDMAWLYERRGEDERALAAIETYLKHHPHNAWAETQRHRLRARTMDPQLLVDETEGLLAFGEELPEAVLPEYLEALFRTGRMGEARRMVFERREVFSVRTAVSAGWVCYRYQAYDLALELFLGAFAAHCANPKFLSGIEFAAARCQRMADLIPLYEAHASHYPPLFSRIRRLKVRASREA
jgi:tetratricopeptide (TPR) repeat protein